MANKLIFTEKRIVSLRTTTQTVVRLIFYRVLGVENEIAQMKCELARQARIILSLQSALYDHAETFADLEKELKSDGKAKQEITH